ncbi:MAG: hypothetical protein U9P72_00015 [Campylobacterota bacterium]|nr:hypothetical protein [Campylobacterota bacterium]
MDKELVEIAHATLKFYKYEQNGLTYYEFDAVECTAPEPMVNCMCGLAMLKNDNDRLVGKFFHEPFPLYQRISAKFEFKSEELDNGNFVVIFKCK